MCNVMCQVVNFIKMYQNLKDKAEVHSCPWQILKLKILLKYYDMIEISDILCVQLAYRQRQHK
jgi:hypothetical protein